MWEKIQWEATQEQYILNFIMVNIIFIISFINRNKVKTSGAVWGSLLLFVLYAFWDTDYFSMRYTFYNELNAGFRDPLYYYLSFISLGSYTIFRLIVWGSALLLFYKTIRKFKLSLNYTAFLFAVFYLLTFSFGRISLGVALYLYGISFFLYPSKRVMSSYYKGVFFVVASYLGHRGMILPILLTPIILFNPTKKLVSVILVSGFLLSQVLAIFLSQLIAGNLVIGSGSAAEDALLSYVSNENELIMNWKFALTSKLRWYSIYFLTGYCVWKCFFSKYRTLVSLNIKRLAVVCLALFLVSYCFLQFNTIGANEIGERYILILGLPLMFILSYLHSKKMCSSKAVFLLLLPAFLYAEGFIFGKILSF